MVTKQCGLCAKELLTTQHRFCSRKCYFENKKIKNQKKEACESVGVPTHEVKIEINLEKPSVIMGLFSFIKEGIKFVLGAFLVTVILLLALIVNHAFFLILVVLFSSYFVWELLTKI